MARPYLSTGLAFSQPRQKRRARIAGASLLAFGAALLATQNARQAIVTGVNAPVIGAANRGEYDLGDPSPRGLMQTPTPTVSWKVAPPGDARVTFVSMTLNDKRVQASYEEKEQVISYTPSDPLAPGLYNVHCEVVADDGGSVEREWQFRVAPGAIQTERAVSVGATIKAPSLIVARAPSAASAVAPGLAGPGGTVGRLVEAVNALRRPLNLPPVSYDARLSKAASGHIGYLVRNRVVAHEETAGKPGFTGEDASARAAAQGYGTGCFETLNQGITAPHEAVNELFDAPYHRLPFLQTGAPDFGGGAQGELVNLLFGANDSEGVVTYPYDGQKNVPLSWEGNESPNPLRVHGDAMGPFGYVITLFHYGDPEFAGVRNVKATLTTSDGKAVAVYLNTPQNDPMLQQGVFLIPRVPLAPGTSYVVSVSARSDNGADLSRTWRFTTAASQTAARQNRLACLSARPSR